ncbi:MAG: 1-phosphofructokinase family hexose kinase [Clostridiales bacterium]|nr:1-phosphofructokinase family hexose kinase [Clostridiales bacterium]
MILTVTLNASIDKLYLLPSVQPETVMRVQEAHNSAGGKGLNVSRVAAKLGETVTAMGFTGGLNGQYLESLICQPEVRCAFTHVKGETRCCINCWDLSNGKSTEYLEPGAAVSVEELSRFYKDFEAQLPNAGVVAISGSVPKGVPADAYCQLIRRCKAADVPVMVDTSGERLVAAAAECPTFIKPNTDEIAQLLGYAPADLESLAAAAQSLHQKGTRYVVVSMGAEGALLACDEGTYLGKPPLITPKNTVGCGDSMVAGFAVGFARKQPVCDCFRMALAVSAANALSLYTGDFCEADYQRLYPEVTIQKIA